MQFQAISILAPSRERRRCRQQMGSSSNFNPRSLTGATVPDHAISNISTFQSSLPHGSDSLPLKVFVLSHKFQSSLPHGSDFSIQIFSSISFNFNPRSLTGATARSGSATRKRMISILAPSRERPLMLKHGQAATLFQSSLPHGSDKRANLFSTVYTPFQSSLPHGSDGRSSRCKQRGPAFQSSLPHGSDCIDDFCKSHIWISILAPSRERRGRLH